MTSSQQQADEALAIYQSNRDDQIRIDMLLREYFDQVRRDEYAAIMKKLNGIWSETDE
jgi:hypothetical protein